MEPCSADTHPCTHQSMVLEEIKHLRLAQEQTTKELASVVLELQDLRASWSLGAQLPVAADTPWFSKAAVLPDLLGPGSPGAASHSSPNEEAATPQKIKSKAIKRSGTTDSHGSVASTQTWITKSLRNSQSFAENLPHHEVRRQLSRRSGSNTSLGARFSVWISMFRAHLKTLKEPERTGCLHDVIESWYFDSFMFVTILANTAFVTWSVQWSFQSLHDASADKFAWLEFLFVSLFALDVAARIIVHRLFFFYCEDLGWNIFDFALVVLSFVESILAFACCSETSSTSFWRALRLLKLGKVLRVLRVLSLFRELSNILESFKQCSISVFWSILMVIFTLYIFALSFMVGLTEHLKSGEPSVDCPNPDELFGNILQGMLSLYMVVSGGTDWSHVYSCAVLAGDVYCVLFVLCTFCFAFVIFNILTGVFAEKAMVAFQPDREEETLEHYKRQVDAAAEFRHLCDVMDLDHNGMITFKEFGSAMEMPAMIAYIERCGLKVDDAEHFFRVVAGGIQNAVEIDEFVFGCMSSRGTATRLDVQKHRWEMKRTKKMMELWQMENAERMSKIEMLCSALVAMTQRSNTEASENVVEKTQQHRIPMENCEESIEVAAVRSAEVGASKGKLLNNDEERRLEI